MRLVVETLACRRGGRRVFAGVGFAVEPGGALVLTGRNGSGKSTLLAALAGFLRPEAGRIAADGIGERSLPEALHLVAHRDGLKTALTAAENLAVAAALLGETRLSPGEALAALGLPRAVAGLPVGYLSAGQRRRVALARLLVAHRPLWLLDEPTTALDAPAQTMLLGLLEAHRRVGGLVIAATHAPIALAGAAELDLDAHRPGRGAP